MVGFSTNFHTALLGRVLGGLLNGNIGVIQTMVGELVKKPEHEAKAYAVMPFVWAIGCIIGPAVGGTLANAVKSYPGFFSKGGFWEHYPWLLPNIVCAVAMAMSFVAGLIWAEETHPDFRKGADPAIHHDIAEHTPMIGGAGTVQDQAVDLTHESYGTFNEVNVGKGGPSSRTTSLSDQTSGKWLSRKIAMLVLALAIYTYHSMCYDHLLPIFLQDEPGNEELAIMAHSPFHISGGLGLTTKAVGLIMSVNGIIALFIQAVIFPWVADRLGIWRTFVMVTLLHPIVFFIQPYLAFLPSNLTYVGIYACLALRNFLSILDYPVILIMLKQSSPSTAVLGRINGLAASAGAAMRTIAPPLAGLLYGWGINIGFTGLAWFGAGIVALLGVVQLYFVPKEKNDRTHIRSVGHVAGEPEAEARDEVDVTVSEV